MDKKGIDERQILWIFYFVMLVIIILSGIAFVNRTVNKIGLDEEYYARDLAFTLSMVESGNGDVIFNYKINEENFDFYIGKIDEVNKVVVGKDLSNVGDGFESRSYRYYSLGEFGIFKMPENLVFSRSNGRLAINEMTANLNLGIGDYLSGVISKDRFGSYRWVLEMVDEDKAIVRKEYVGIDENIADKATNTKNLIGGRLEKYDSIIAIASEKYGISVSMIQAIIWKESTGNSGIVNQVSGAVGLMQLLPSTAQLTKEQLLDPATNIDAGTKYFSQQLKRLLYDELALAAYNWGPGNVAKNCNTTFSTCQKLPSETINYVERVIGFRNEIDIANGEFAVGRSGEVIEIKLGEIEILDSEHTVEVTSLGDAGNVGVEVT